MKNYFSCLRTSFFGYLTFGGNVLLFWYWHIVTLDLWKCTPFLQRLFSIQPCLPHLIPKPFSDMLTPDRSIILICNTSNHCLFHYHALSVLRHMLGKWHQYTEARCLIVKSYSDVKGWSLWKTHLEGANWQKHVFSFLQKYISEVYLFKSIVSAWVIIPMISLISWSIPYFGTGILFSVRWKLSIGTQLLNSAPHLGIISRVALRWNTFSLWN